MRFLFLLGVFKSMFLGFERHVGSKEETKIAEAKHLSLSVFPGAFPFPDSNFVCFALYYLAFASSPSASKVSIRIRDPLVRSIILYSSARARQLVTGRASRLGGQMHAWPCACPPAIAIDPHQRFSALACWCHTAFSRAAPSIVVVQIRIAAAASSFLDDA